jgi:hypothetical protein
MTDNNLPYLNDNIQSEAPKRTTGALHPFQIINHLLSVKDSTKDPTSFTQSFLEYLVSQPDVIQACYYTIEPKTRDIKLNNFLSKPLVEKDLSTVSIPARSTETLARVAFNAQMLVVADLETQLVNYQSALLDPRARSLFISPNMKEGQVVSLLDIQFECTHGVTSEEAPGLSLAIQLFGNFLEDVSITHEAGQSFPDLINYARVSRELIASDGSQSLNKILLSAFQNSDLIAFIFQVGEYDLTLEDLFDAKGTGFDASLIGLKVETHGFEGTIRKNETQFFSDLPANYEMGDLFSFFIRRECTSLAILPISLESNIQKILLIGSRENEPINSEKIHTYQRILENYEDRIAFDFRATQTNNLERDFRFLLETSNLISIPLDQQQFFSSLLKTMKLFYGENLSIHLVEANELNSIIQTTSFSSSDIPVTFERSYSPSDFAFLKELSEPVIYKNADPALSEVFTSFDPQSESIIVPITGNVENMDLLFLNYSSGQKALQDVSILALNSLGKIISSYFVQRNLRDALANLDLTVSRTVNRQQILNQISIQAGSGRTQNEILGSIPQQLVTLGLCDQACILLPNHQGNFEIRHSQALTDDQKSQIIGPGEKLAWKSVSRNKAEFISSEQTTNNDNFINPSNLSGLAAPISFGDQVLALLELEHSKPDQYNDYDLELITIFCLSIGSLLANLNLVDQVRTQVNRQEKLFEVTNKLRRTLDMNTILQISATEIAKIAHAKKASIQIKIAEEPLPEVDSELSGGEA